MQVGGEDGRAADEVEVDALGGLGEVGDGGEEEDAGFEVQRTGGGGGGGLLLLLLLVLAVEDLERDVGA